MEKRIKTIALTWGGTWGHTIPLTSLYNYLKEVQKDEESLTEYKFIWVGERDSLEKKIATENDIPFYDISAGKIRRYFDLRNFYEPLKNLTGFFEGIYHIHKHKIDIVFSKGWYVSLPLCLAAKIMMKKVYVHESDSVTGLANTIVSKFATKVFYSFENPKIDGKKHIHSWSIVSPELIDGIKTLQVEENDKLEVLVIAGSQWSTTIFKALLKSLPDLQDIHFHVILWDKNTHFEEDFSTFKNVKVHDFISQKKLGKILQKTDIAITRGSSTLWELFYFGIHSIIIPLKATWGNHQYHNAMYFKENFGSNVLDEDDNLNLELFRHLQKFKSLRKTGLNMDGFFDGLRKIHEELEL